MSRTYRKQKTGAKAFASHCRNHGSCSYCQDNRTHFDRKWRPDEPTVVDAWEETDEFFGDTIENAEELMYADNQDQWYYWYCHPNYEEWLNERNITETDED